MARLIFKDPSTNKIRYIGKSKNPKQRWSGHIKFATKGDNSHRSRWIRQLLKENLVPDYEILEEVPLDDWQRYEKKWVQFAKEQGFDLTNMTEGGDGFSEGCIPWNKGGTIPQYQIERLREFNTGRKPSDETRKKLRESHLGKTLSEEQKRKIGEKGKGRKMPLEVKKKIGDANRGRIMSDEFRQAISERRKGTKLSEEHKRKIGEKSKGRTHNEETRKKLSLLHLCNHISIVIIILEIVIKFS